MKILMYGWEYPPHINGGLGIACSGIVQGLTANQMTVTLILPEDYLKAYTESNDDLFRKVTRYTETRSLAAANIPHDVIHAHDWLTILAGLQAKKISHQPLIFHVHSLELDRSGENINQTIFEIEKRGMMEADQVIAVSYYTKNRIVNDYQIPADKIAVVYNGLFPSQIKNNDFCLAPKKNILYLGRMTQQKGLSYFIEAACKILTKRQDIRFIIAGEGDQFNATVSHIAALRMSAYFHFTGFLSRELVEEIFYQSVAYVMPSRSEPFGIACLEALGCGTPVIISKQSGAAEILKNAIKVDFGDTHDLADKMIALVDHPMLRKELLKNSKKEISELTWHNLTKNIISIYEKLLENK